MKAEYEAEIKGGDPISGLLILTFCDGRPGNDLKRGQTKESNDADDNVIVATTSDTNGNGDGCDGGDRDYGNDDSGRNIDSDDMNSNDNNGHK